MIESNEIEILAFNKSFLGQKPSYNKMQYIKYKN